MSSIFRQFLVADPLREPTVIEGRRKAPTPTKPRPSYAVQRRAQAVFAGLADLACASPTGPYGVRFRRNAILRL